METQVKMVRCYFCGQEVTKRSTLSLKELGLEEGRACRVHQEVKDAVANMTARKQREKDFKKADEVLQTLAGVAAVRVMHTFFGWPVSLVMARLRMRGFSGNALNQIKKDLERSGGPLMTADEMIETVKALPMVLQRS